MGWNYKSQSKPASKSQQYGSSQGFGGASAESKGTAVMNRESWGGDDSKGIDGIGVLLWVTCHGVMSGSEKGL